MSAQKFIILDRDGVINQDSASYIKTPDEWQAIPDSLESIVRLCNEGYRVVIITNQSGVGRGLLSVDVLNRIHEKMLSKIHQLGGEIGAIFFCPHVDEDSCECRKPKTGLFKEFANRMHCNLAETFSIGDSLRDLQAAHLAGSRPILVGTGNGKKTRQWLDENSHHELYAVPYFENLKEFVDVLLDKSTTLDK